MKLTILDAGINFGGDRESAFTYDRFSTCSPPDGTSMVSAGTTLRAAAGFAGKPTMEPSFNLHQDHRFDLKSAIFERFGP